MADPGCTGLPLVSALSVTMMVRMTRHNDVTMKKRMQKEEGGVLSLFLVSGT